VSGISATLHYVKSHPSTNSGQAFSQNRREVGHPSSWFSGKNSPPPRLFRAIAFPRSLPYIEPVPARRALGRVELQGVVMKGKWLSLIVLIGIAVCLVAEASCARSQQLESITIQPSSVTFLSPFTTLTFQLKAYGAFIHPPETKDITDQVTWTSSAPALSVVSNTGVVAVSGNGSCGANVVTATAPATPGNPNGLITSTASVTVDDINVSVCPQ
jgi:hypothetical protein